MPRTRPALITLGSLALALAAAGLLRHLDADLIGRAVGDGERHAVLAFDTVVGSAFEATGLDAAQTADGAIFSQVVTTEGGDAVNVRHDGARFRLHEIDGNDSHKPETVSTVALLGDPAALGIDGEIGAVTLGQNAAEDITVSLAFERTYEAPVLFLQVATFHGSHPVTALPVSITGEGATIRLKEPAGRGGSHATETVHWAVIDAGVYALPDDRVMVVGKRFRETADFDLFDPWMDIDLGATFAGEAAVITRIQSADTDDFVGTRTLRRQTAAGHTDAIATEFMRSSSMGEDAERVRGEVGYLAVGAVRSKIEAARVDGVRLGWSESGLDETVAAAGVVLAGIVGVAEADAAIVRRAGDGRVKLQEAREGPQSHAGETVHLVGFSGDPASLGVPMETGEVTMGVGAVDVAFEHPYDAPVVFAQIATVNGGSPAAATITAVRPDGFTVRLREPAAFDDHHNAERVQYAVIEAGSYETRAGRVLHAGTVSLPGDAAFHPVELGGLQVDRARIVTRLQDAPADFAGTRTRHSEDGERLTAVEVAYMADDSDPGAAHPAATVGYLVYGRLPVDLCGNGVVDVGEECDGGGAVSDSCTVDCRARTHDIDGDGYADVVIADGGGASQLCLGDGCGGFTCSAFGSHLLDAAIGDLNGDGFEDVLRVRFSGLMDVCLNDGAGALSCAPVAEVPDGLHQIELADMDGDGDLDAVYGGMTRVGASIHVIHPGEPGVCFNDGAGLLRDCAPVRGEQWLVGNQRDLALGDVDGDGDLDVVFAREHGSTNGDASLPGYNALCLNDGAGALDCDPIGDSDLTSAGVGLGDVDGDGDLDAVFANEDAQPEVCLGDGAGGFACALRDGMGEGAFDALVDDLDGDGVAEIFVANHGARSVLCNGGSGNCVYAVPGSHPVRRATFADMDGDGLKDVVLVNEDDDDLWCPGAYIPGFSYFFGGCAPLPTASGLPTSAPSGVAAAGGTRACE